MAPTSRSRHPLPVNKRKLPTPSLGLATDNESTHIPGGGSVIRHCLQFRVFPPQLELVRDLQVFPYRPCRPAQSRRRVQICVETHRSSLYSPRPISLQLHCPHTTPSARPLIEGVVQVIDLLWADCPLTMNNQPIANPLGVTSSATRL